MEFWGQGEAIKQGKEAEGRSYTTVGPHWRAKEISVYWVKKSSMKKKKGDIERLLDLCFIWRHFKGMLQ